MQSIVEYFSGQEGHSCGYCKSSNTFYSNGMWAHTLTTTDYQNLIDRGWRRSGKYCYKPTMNITCCPLYTIRCETKKFTLTKSQKKVLKKVHRFLAYGDQGKRSQSPSSENSEQREMDGVEFSPDISAENLKRIEDIKSTDIEYSELESDSNLKSDETSSADVQLPKSSFSSSGSPSIVNKCNENSNRPKCQKAKVLRREKKLQKLLKKGIQPDLAAASVKKTPNQPKSLEEFLSEPHISDPAHKLEVKFVYVNSKEFLETKKESYSLYVKYQMAIHNDTEEECAVESFENFLIETPLESLDEISLVGQTYGSYHQQYWLDDKLIAVGVLDILPYSVSSVYFYYDPDYSFLSLGTYSALREISLTRQLNAQYNDLQYYYMGYYIHSCIKMRYKGQYVPSYLLCPEAYTFHPIEKCKPLLDKSKFCRLEEDTKIEDCDGKVVLKDVIILYKSKKMLYSLYRIGKLGVNEDEEIVQEYAKLVGQKCYKRMMLYRS
ncbi:arginyl-tRNA--protein transferase 1 isoform X3 [Parasteatoda tepidariorum]|uniref:arginyl-tRNA--protein transferase 1 isoform X3 n=1 Tax=Parasteatoda tepidariorum TaxID=114398 RepID=UPI00077F89E4|nr:arginyl-tRNA--protein transferase 1 isoform X3 [Parasteatoda tepidariorum]